MLMLNDFAERLIATSEAERTELLEKNVDVSGIELAKLLKEACYKAWTSESSKVAAIAGALRSLANFNSQAEIRALAAWSGGIENIVNGSPAEATVNLQLAEQIFFSHHNFYEAAQTQVALLYALALQGEYELAIETGKKALAVFVVHNDELSAGKIEKNLGNIFVRRHAYQTAQKYLEAARRRFLKLDNNTQIAMIDNSLAIVYALQNDFRRAEDLYLKALSRAEKANLAVTKAETEASLGNLALFRGRYDEALKYLEKSRSGYDALEMPHQMAIADLEIADVYLELNLLQEACGIYQRIAPLFESFKMRAEEARTRANYGRTLARLGATETALTELERAATLYRLEENNVGTGFVKLTLGNLNLREKNYPAAHILSTEAENIFREANSPRNVLLSELVRGESEKYSGKTTVAENTFRGVLRRATREEHPQIAWIAANALGSAAQEQNDFLRAENYFRKAVETIESLRSPLAADEFRTAFFTDKLAPYQNLADICRHDESRISESLKWIERARSQSLLDLLADSNHKEILLDNASLQTKLDYLREKLNWFYNRLTRPINEIGAAASEVKNIHDEIRRHENEINALVLQAQASREILVRRGNNFDLAQLQTALGQERVLIEFAEFDGRFAAFVVGETGVELIENLGSAAEIQSVLEQLHFQFATLRYGTTNLQKHLPLLKKRADHLLQNLYNLLLLPLEDLIAEKHLIIVPAKNLHYVPFQALRSGAKYLIENCAVSFAPSAAVLQNLLQRDSKVIKKVLAVAFADERVPQVEQEVKNLASVVPQTIVLAGTDATFAGVRERLQNEFFDVLHLACHGQFRPENPLFSSLHLADGWATVREAAGLRLDNALVVLSACETGLSQIAAGEELLGLIRGFLAAGANTLIISLWTVNDAAAADFMSDFYRNLKNKSSPAASLRAAQMKLIEQDAHPYFWAPFILTGRW